MPERRKGIGEPLPLFQVGQAAASGSRQGGGRGGNRVPLLEPWEPIVNTIGWAPKWGLPEDNPAVISYYVQGEKRV